MSRGLLVAILLGLLCLAAHFAWQLTIFREWHVSSVLHLLNYFGMLVMP
jgi:hypothetical protein